MAQHAAPTTLETTVNNLTNECEDGQDNQQPTAYTPVFSKGVRTVVYVAGLIASCVGLGFMTFGDAVINFFGVRLKLGCGKICGTVVSVEFFTPVF